MCAMSPRLLRPIAGGIHPEAAAWRQAVIDNGGSVSGSTVRAVSDFCRRIDAAGIRDRFLRVNIFAGNDLNAALVPLYRAWAKYSGRNINRYGNVRAWTQSDTATTVSTGERPFSYGPYAYTVTADAGSGVTPYVVSPSDVTYGYGTITVSAYLKANGQTTVRLLLSGSAGMTFEGESVAVAEIDLTTGGVSTFPAGATATATDAGNGWWRLSLTVANSGTGQMAIRVDVGSGSPYNATGSESFFIWGVQSEVASAASAYEPYPLGNATDTNSGPFVTDNFSEDAGLKGDGTTKSLDTTLRQDDGSLSNLHMAVSFAELEASGTRGLLTNNGGVSPSLADFAAIAAATELECLAPGLPALTTTRTTAASHLMGSRSSNTRVDLYLDGASVAFSTDPVTPVHQATTYRLFNRKDGDSLVLFTEMRLRYYSVGFAVDGASAASLANAVAALNAALGRS